MPNTYDFCGWATKNDVLCSDGRTIRRDAFKDCDGKIVPIVWNHQHNSINNVLGHGMLKNTPEGVRIFGTFNDTEDGLRAKRLVEHGDVVSLSIYANQLKQRKSDVLHGNIREVSLVLAGANPAAFIDTVIAHSDGEDEEAVIFFDERISLSHKDLDPEAEEDEKEPESNEEDEKEPDEKKKDEESEPENSKSEEKSAEETSEDGEVSHADDSQTVFDIFNGMSEKQQNAVLYLVAQALGMEDDSDEAAQSAEEAEEADEETINDIIGTLNEDQKKAAYAMIQLAMEEPEDSEMAHSDDKTVQEVFNTLTEEQKTVVYALVGTALLHSDDNNEEEDQDMKHNLFDKENENQRNTLSHADQKAILDAARNSRGSFREVLGAYVEDNFLQHADGDDDTAPVSGFTEDYFEYLFPEYKDVRPGAPELVTNDQTWVNAVMQKVHKTPFNRIRTRQVDVREIAALRAKGYDKGTKKALTGNYALIHRTTDPQTVYVKNALNRDDILDITDFDYVQYQYNIDRLMLNEELAIAVMLGDGREDDAADKIHPEHIRPIWTDDELYSIHVDIDLDATQSEIQGSGTGTYFGENFIYSESIINASLYAREQYRGSGTPDFFCTPHLVNIMLLARDRTGRRIYSDVNDLAKALNVGKIYTAEQFANKTRTFTPQGGSETTKKLLGIFVNLADYNMGAAKGGQIAKFNQFDIDFNQEKSLIETRTSGALTRIKSAIVLEEDVTSNP